MSDIDSIINSWASTIIQTTSSSIHCKRCIVAISGIPGSGKTTFATRLLNAINRPGQDEIAVLVGLDGWHYPRTVLDTFPDPSEAHRRRGAEFTFDGDSFIKFIQQLRLSYSGADKNKSNYAPSFAHNLKDPVSNSIPIHPHHKIIIFEGLYLLMDRPPWNAALMLYDHRIFINVHDRNIAIDRLESRHFDTGVEATRQQARNRAINSDMVNGEEIIANLPSANRFVEITLPDISQM